MFNQKTCFKKKTLRLSSRTPLEYLLRSCPGLYKHELNQTFSHLKENAVQDTTQPVCTNN